MKISLEDVSLLQVRVLFDLDQYVDARKKDVAYGTQTLEIAALQAKYYGYGLARALAIAEDLLEGPNSNLKDLVDRIVLEIDPNAGDDGQKR